MTNQINTALLTTGSGPLSNATLKSLLENSSLKVVVFSRKNKRLSIVKRLKDYGSWGSFQFLSSISMNKLYNYQIKEKDILLHDIEIANWGKSSDEQKILSTLKRKKIEIIFVCSFQHRLNPSFYNQFTHCLNIHPSLLPEYRGPEPIFWGLLDKKTTFGVTVHQIDDGVDTGDIIAQTVINRPIVPISWFVENDLAQKIQPMLSDVIQKIKTGSLKPQKQNGGFYRSFATVENRRKSLLNTSPTNTPPTS